MNNPDLIPIIIVTWNNEIDIKECIQSILSQTYQKIKIIVVDNASSDNTVKIIEENFPELLILKQTKNFYLTGANNIGIRYVFKNYNGKYLMVLNPDTKLETNLVEQLKESLDKNPNACASGPKIKFYKSEKEGLINSAGLIYDGFLQAYDRGFMEKDLGQYDKDEEVFGVSGACILYRVEALKQTALYWDRIKLYLDEVELFIRLHKKGWKVIYEPKAVLWHAYMRSSNQNRRVNIEKEKRKVMLLIALRHYPLKRKLAMLKHYLAFQLKSN